MLYARAMRFSSREAMTVIMPVRNAQRTAIRAAESVIRQLSQADRLVMCDDFSEDGTWHTLLSKYHQHKQVVLLKNNEQLGVALTLNKMLEIVTTPLVGRMDADDISLPGRIRKQKEALQNSDFSFVAGIIGQKVIGLPIILPASPFSIPKEASKFALITTNPFFHPGAAFRLSPVLELGGYRDVPGQDYDLWLRAAVSGFELTKESGWGIIYRRHAKQASKSYGQKLSLLNSTDPNLVAKRFELARELGLNGKEEESINLQAIANLRQLDRFFRLKRWS